MRRKENLKRDRETLVRQYSIGLRIEKEASDKQEEAGHLRRSLQRKYLLRIWSCGLQCSTYITNLVCLYNQYNMKY